MIFLCPNLDRHTRAPPPLLPSDRGVAEVMNFAADFDAALTLWMGIAEQLASNSGRALLAPLLRDLRSEADKISVIFTHFQLEVCGWVVGWLGGWLVGWLVG